MKLCAVVLLCAWMVGGSGSGIVSPQLTEIQTIIDVPGYHVRDITPPVLYKGAWHAFATRIPVSQGQPGYHGRIAHFYTNASDPIVNWSEDPNLAVDVGKEGEWDCTGVFTPGVIYDESNSTWFLIYAGVGPNYVHHEGRNFSQWQGLATAPSPFGPWTKSPYNPIIKSNSGPSPLNSPSSTCNASALHNEMNLIGHDIAHDEVADVDACIAWSCAQGGDSFTFTSSQPHTTSHCAQGSKCCWAKKGATNFTSEDNCISGLIPDAPASTWTYIRLGNARPMFVNGGTQRLLVLKQVQLDFNALPGVYYPNDPSTSFHPPYHAYPNNPVIRDDPKHLPNGFENQEFFVGPDNYLHTIGSPHGGVVGNPHYVNASDDGLNWTWVETHPSWGEPAPLASGVPGDMNTIPSHFIKFGPNGEKRLVVDIYNITWTPVN